MKKRKEKETVAWGAPLHVMKWGDSNKERKNLFETGRKKEMRHSGCLRVGPKTKPGTGEGNVKRETNHTQKAGGGRARPRPGQTVPGRPVAKKERKNTKNLENGKR